MEACLFSSLSARWYGRILGGVGTGQLLCSLFFLVSVGFSSSAVVAFLGARSVLFVLP